MPPPAPPGYVPDVRRLVPWLAALVVLVALWPAVCGSAEDGPTTCQSAAFLPLPWGDSADTWGIVVALTAALLTYLGSRRLLLPDRQASERGAGS